MFQSMALFDSLTVFDNIALPLREKTTLSEREIADKVTRTVQQLEIAEVMTRYPSQISGGMMKRVALARALITDPEIILFDEPTTGLDPLRKNAVLSLISHYQKKFGYTSIVVSHDIPDVFYISNRVAMLENGKILFQGTPAEIQQCDIPVVQEFITSHEALKDELTGFDTKKRLEHRFKQESCRCEYGEGTFSIAIFRIVGLGLIVERLGATAGQRLIQGFANLVRQHTRPIDISARYSRNEIITVLPCTDETSAASLCARLAETLRGRDLLAESNRAAPYSIQAGAAEAGAESQIEEVVRRAEGNMSVLADYGRTDDSPGGVAHPPLEQTSTAERP
jgi:phospholipid/cholesterol/gamma-HCH transport system ATP-binding protein